jgi:toxin ParE1/3/4
LIIIWAPRATAHLAALHARIARDNPRAAAQTLATIVNAADVLADHPNIGRPGRVPGSRELVVPGTPYVLPYRLHSDRIDIIAVFHERQKWPKRL